MSGFQGIELPKGKVKYPTELCVRRDSLIRAFENEKRTPNIRVRLSLIAKAFNLFAEQLVFENGLKTKALGVVMRDRMQAQRKLLNG